MIDSDVIRAQTHGELLTKLLDAPQTGIRNVLERLGTLQVVGSYALGLISNYTKEPDIDMNLLVPPETDLVEAASAIGKDVVSGTGPWHKYEVYDNRKAQRPAMPRSVYLGLKAYTPSTKVAADVWFFNKQELFEKAGRNHQYILDALANHPEYRDYIVAIKDELTKNGDHISGYSIYRAVIEEGVTTTAELKALTAETLDRLHSW